MMRKILITAGSTVVPIDRVRAITNIFRGKTGHDIARYLAREGDDVTLVTSSEGAVRGGASHVLRYRTFDELRDIMRREITTREYDAVIHSAAVSDYRVGGSYTREADGSLIRLEEGGKMSSSHERLFLELVPTEKIIDLIRSEWGFDGALVKFKLEVGRTDRELIEIARTSGAVSRADIVVANCLEWYRKRAFIVRGDGQVTEIERRELSDAVRLAIEEVVTRNNHNGGQI